VQRSMKSAGRPEVRAFSLASQSLKSVGTLPGYWADSVGSPFCVQASRVDVKYAARDGRPERVGLADCSVSSSFTLFYEGSKAILRGRTRGSSKAPERPANCRAV